MSFSNRKTLFLFGFIFVLLAAIPLTVFILQKQQQTEIGATASTTLSFANTTGEIISLEKPLQVKTGEVFNIDVIADPGTNQITLVNLKINYDSEILAPEAEGSLCSKEVCANPDALALEKIDNLEGQVGVTFSKRMDISRVIQTKTKLATVRFKALKETPTAMQLTFNGSIVNSMNASQDATEENVLSISNPGFVFISANGASPTPTITPTPSGRLTITPTPRLTITPTPTGGNGNLTENESPVCTSLNVDRETSGSTPFSIAFTATGSDTDGKITKVTFNFGDGPVQDVVQAGGIGTDSVSVQVSHTYTNPGTFQASAILTDDRKGVSDQTTCTQTITVSESQEIIPTEEIIPTKPPFVQAPGPGNLVVGAGVGALILSILGGLILFAL